GKEVVLTFKENKELIGGLVVRVGDTILDGSVKAQLENIKDKLLEGVV
ncbi:MAG: F0F1 ATP synthase subunit delta, partial [Deltaproteobacteria bacterium]|nr:F0F1 ATP synthase subunit delta [Deltaproteobacteria bacterium]